jgi:flagellar FliL protein
MKKIMIFVVVGAVMFAVGLGVGLMFGRSTASTEPAGGAKSVDAPGPLVSVGEFTSNLAGSGRHVISFTVSLETLTNPKAAETVGGAWLPRIKNEILLIVKDKVYEDLTSAEGTLQFAEEIKRALNAQLPEINGEAPVMRVLFETFVLQ